MMAACYLSGKEASAEERSSEVTSTVEEAEDADPVCAKCGAHYFEGEVPFPEWDLCDGCCEGRNWDDEYWRFLSQCWCGGMKRNKFPTCLQCFVENADDASEESSRGEYDSYESEGTDDW